MRRVVVFGTTGSGKSTLAERLAQQKGLRVIELDALYWGRDWQGAPVELFRYRVECETRDGDWIVVGNYGQVRDLVWRPADTLIWLDLPLSIVMWRLFWRTLRRVLSQEDLWGSGNRETWRTAFFSRQSILVWAWTTHRRNRQRFARECQALADQKRVIRLTSKREVERFMTAS
ncbi:MAG: adenylate kinase [Alphaproteobacteria bacterium]|nr:adenylate kinase [Alphaproteobacteria bacterium]MBV8408090.1 adenylate kinase [Alphaproteobacteria bacterium]